MFPLELRGCSNCRKELRTRWPPSQSGPDQLLRANFPTSPATSLLQDSLTPARLHLLPIALEHAVPSLGIALTPPYPQIVWAGLQVPLFRLRQMSLPHVPSLPWIHHTMCDAQGISMVCSVSGSLPASALQEGRDRGRQGPQWMFAK